MKFALREISAQLMFNDTFFISDCLFSVIVSNCSVIVVITSLLFNFSLEFTKQVSYSIETEKEHCLTVKLYNRLSLNVFTNVLIFRISYDAHSSTFKMFK